MTTAEDTIVLPRRGLVLGGVMMALGLAAPKGAHAHAAPVELAVLDRESGQTLHAWRHGQRAFVAGAPGSRYGLRVTNRTGNRILAVLSVDGVNILTGETAAYDQRGYVFDPYQSYAVTGWRKSDDEVADFTFTSLALSYAARTGRPGEVGVIGMAVFGEKVQPSAQAMGETDDATPPNITIHRRFTGPLPMDAPAPAAALGASAPAPVTRTRPYAGAALEDRSRAGSLEAPHGDRLGTGHGPRELSMVRTVAFERATQRPQSVCEIEYDTFDHLVARGVIPPRPGRPRDPRPFPMAPDPGGFVPDPPGC